MKSGLVSPQIFTRPAADFVWHNYFDKDDVLGYPMRAMGSAFKVDWLYDHAISVGGFLTGWNPVSPDLNMGMLQPVVTRCEQASNYIWDARTGKRFFAGASTVGDEMDAFRRLGSCNKSW